MDSEVPKRMFQYERGENTYKIAEETSRVKSQQAKYQ